MFNSFFNVFYFILYFADDYDEGQEVVRQLDDDATLSIDDILSNMKGNGEARPKRTYRPSAKALENAASQPTSSER